MPTVSGGGGAGWKGAVSVSGAGRWDRGDPCDNQQGARDKQDAGTNEGACGKIGQMGPERGE